MHPDTPLADAELDELEQFLISDATSEACMDIAMLDGFLTALIIAPDTILPSQWLPAIWGETDENETAWDSAEQMQRILGLVLRMYNDRVRDLHEAIDAYDPLLYQNEREGVPILDEWCTGFVRAIELDPRGWQPLLEADSEAAGGLLTPMLLYGTEAGWKELQRNPELAARHLDFADAIGPCVIGIRDYWLPHRKTSATLRRATPKVGRNEPCPCGSGKKFKQCCGSGERRQ